MLSAPAFTVVCAAYNAESTIDRALRSCLAQTYSPREVIVVDDGSTDATAAVVTSLADTRVRVIRLGINRGPSAARNAGLDAATPRNFIAFLDADDWWHPEKLAAAAQALAHNPRALLFHNYDVEGKDIPLRGLTVVRWRLWKLLIRNTVATPCVVIQADSGVRFDEALRRMEDWDFFLRYTERHGAQFLNLPLTHLGRKPLSGGGLSGARWLMRKAEMRVYAKWAFARPLYLPMLPVFFLWSLLKGLAKELIRD